MYAYIYITWTSKFNKKLGKTSGVLRRLFLELSCWRPRISWENATSSLAKGGFQFFFCFPVCPRDYVLSQILQQDTELVDSWLETSGGLHKCWSVLVATKAPLRSWGDHLWQYKTQNWQQGVISKAFCCLGTTEHTQCTSGLTVFITRYIASDNGM